MTKIHDYINDAASDPIKGDDYLDMDNEDGVGGYDVSKKIKVSEFIAFLSTNLDFEGTDNRVPFFFDGGLMDSHFIYGEGGMHVDLSKVFAVGTTIDGNVKVKIKGGTNDNSAAGLIVYNSDDDYGLWVDNDLLVYLANGAGINEFSTDGTLVGDSDEAVPTEKAVKTYVDGLIAPQIIGGVTLSSSSNTNILNGTYVILADTTTVTSVTSGIGQDSNWTLEITQAGITNQKGVITFTGNLEKDAGGGANYDVAIFKNGSIVSESEQIDQKLESGGKGQSVTVMTITEFSTSDTFDIRVSGNGTADDIFCGGGSLYIQ